MTQAALSESPLLLHFFLESEQLRRPECLDESGDWGEALRPDRVEVLGALAPCFDKACFAENRELLRRSLLRHVGYDDDSARWRVSVTP